MYFICDRENRIVQLGLGKLSPELARGLVGDGGKLGGALVVWQTKRLELCAKTIPDLRICAKPRTPSGFLFDVLSSVASSSTFAALQRAARQHYKKFAAVLILVALFASVGFTFGTFHSANPESEEGDVRKFETRADILRALESSKLAQSMARNRSRYFFGNLTFLGGQDGIGVLPIGDAGDERLLLVAEQPEFSFLAKNAAQDERRAADARCGTRFLFVLKGNERVAVAQRMTVKDSRRFALFSLTEEEQGRHESSLCSRFQFQLEHAGEEWVRL